MWALAASVLGSLHDSAWIILLLFASVSSCPPKLSQVMMLELDRQQLSGLSKQKCYKFFNTILSLTTTSQHLGRKKKWAHFLKESQLLKITKQKMTLQNFSKQFPAPHLLERWMSEEWRPCWRFIVDGSWEGTRRLKATHLPWSSTRV